MSALRSSRRPKRSPVARYTRVISARPCNGSSGPRSSHPRSQTSRHRRAPGRSRPRPTTPGTRSGPQSADWCMCRAPPGFFGDRARQLAHSVVAAKDAAAFSTTQSGKPFAQHPHRSDTRRIGVGDLRRLPLPTALGGAASPGRPLLRRPWSASHDPAGSSPAISSSERASSASTHCASWITRCRLAAGMTTAPLVSA